MRIVFATLLAMLLGVAPSFSKDPVAPPVLRFADTTVYDVDATSLEFDIQDKTPREYPQVGHLAPITFDQALRTWIDQRFRLTGNSVNKLRVTVREARITEKILPIQKGIKGWFKKEEATEYEAVLNIEIAIVDPNGQALSHAESSAWVSQSLLEGATSDKKSATWVEMINSAFDNVDRELKGRLREYMGRYIN